jgi:hypothetical protein
MESPLVAPVRNNYRSSSAYHDISIGCNNGNYKGQRENHVFLDTLKSQRILGTIAESSPTLIIPLKCSDKLCLEKL